MKKEKWTRVKKLSVSLNDGNSLDFDGNCKVYFMSTGCDLVGIKFKGLTRWIKMDYIDHLFWIYKGKFMIYDSEFYNCKNIKSKPYKPLEDV